jgi:hypothetical protein
LFDSSANRETEMKFKIIWRDPPGERVVEVVGATDAKDEAVQQLASVTVPMGATLDRIEAIDG